MSDYNLYFFADVTKNPFQQTSVLAFGVKDSTRYRLTSSFLTKTDTKAYAIFSGTLLVVLQEGSADVDDKYKKVNLILKPNDLKGIRFPIEYIIYRGLRWDSFFTRENDNEIVKKESDVSNSELLKAMYVAHRKRTGADPIPLQALYGFNYGDTHIDPATKIETYFFTQSAIVNAQLFDVQGGIELGVFAASPTSPESKPDENDTVGQGIDIVLKNADFTPTLAMARKAYYEITVNGWTPQERYAREEVRHFVDPAAFYGTHSNIKGGIAIKINDGWRALSTVPSVYGSIVKFFATKNTVYIDIGNENGYSYNYYGNYGGVNQENIKNFKISDNVTNIAERRYETVGWPVFELKMNDPDVSNPALGAATQNLHFSLLWNGNPQIVIYPYFSNQYIFDSLTTTDNIFTDLLQFIAYIANDTIGSTFMAVRVATIFRLIYLHGYNGNDARTFFPQSFLWDFSFGPVDVDLPWTDETTENLIKWKSSDMLRYFKDMTNSDFTAVMKSGLITEKNGQNLLYYISPVDIQKGYVNGPTNNSFNFEANKTTEDDFITFYLKENYRTRITKNVYDKGGASEKTIYAYQDATYTENNILFLGITKAQLDLLITGNPFSPYHQKFFKLKKLRSIPTAEGVTYDEYRLHIAGLKNDMTYDSYSETEPLLLYTIDHRIFCSDAYTGSSPLIYNDPGFVVNFRRTADYDNNPHFGFDWMRDEYIAELDTVIKPDGTPRGGICDEIPGIATKAEQQRKLKQIYTPFDIKAGSDYHTYYASWLNMYEKHKEKTGQDVILNLEIVHPDLKSTPTPTETDKIRFEVPDGIKLDIDESLKGGITEEYVVYAKKVMQNPTKPIKIICNKASDIDREVRVYNENNQVIGVLNIYKNKDNYRLPIRLVKVNFQGKITYTKPASPSSFEVKMEYDFSEKTYLYSPDGGKSIEGYLNYHTYGWIKKMNLKRNKKFIINYFKQNRFNYNQISQEENLNVNFGDFDINSHSSSDASSLLGIDIIKNSISSIAVIQNAVNAKINLNFPLLGEGLIERYKEDGFSNNLTNEITVFLLPILCEDANDIGLEGFAVDNPNVNGRAVFLVGIPNKVVDFHFLISHEIYHTLSLIHAFKDPSEHQVPVFIFTKYKTDNIMDYIQKKDPMRDDIERKRSLWQWQWEEIENQNFNFKE